MAGPAIAAQHAMRASARRQPGRASLCNTFEDEVPQHIRATDSLSSMLGSPSAPGFVDSMVRRAAAVVRVN